MLPAGVEFACALQVFVPATQVKVPDGQLVGVGGDGGVGGVAAPLQVALYGAPQDPLLQEAYALPVVGGTVSDKTAMAPFAALPAAALQALPATVQLNVVAGQLADGAG